MILPTMYEQGIRQKKKTIRSLEKTCIPMHETDSSFDSFFTIF